MATPKLPDEAITAFQKAWATAGFGEISFDVAAKEAQKLLHLLVRLVKQKH